VTKNLSFRTRSLLSAACVLAPLLASLALVFYGIPALSGSYTRLIQGANMLLVLGPLYLTETWFFYRRRPANEYLSRHWLGAAVTGLCIGAGVLGWNWVNATRDYVGRPHSGQWVTASGDSSLEAFMATDTSARVLPWVYSLTAIGLICLMVWCAYPAWRRHRLKDAVPVEGRITRLDLGGAWHHWIGLDRNPAVQVLVIVTLDGDDLWQEVKLYGTSADIGEYLAKDAPISLWFEPATRKLAVRTAAEDRLMGLPPTDRRLRIGQD
jgi:hypothetical protein